MVPMYSSLTGVWIQDDKMSGMRISEQLKNAERGIITDHGQSQACKGFPSVSGPVGCEQ